VSWILLTNDDGVDSPALRPFARALGRIGRVRVVVPDRERSWVAKAISRFEDVRVARVESDGLEMWTCSGYPADAVQLGIRGLFDEPPSLVVSGVNVGFNFGAAFLMSSGTVGGAVEAWVSGIPGIAVSAGTNGEWNAWKAFVHTPEAGPGWERVADLATGLVDRVRASGLLAAADITTINLPFGSDESTPVQLTTVARVGYDNLFRDRGDGVFGHDFSGNLRAFAGLEGTDLAAVRSGAISVTPLRMPEAAIVSETIRDAFDA
jgi:5'-nucleotidase